MGRSNWRRACGVVAVAAGVGGWSAGAFAQVRPPTGVETPPITFSITPRGEYAFEADLKETGDSSVSVGRAGVGFGLVVPLNEKFRVLFNADAEASWYEFGGSGAIVAGSNDPVNDVLRVQLSPGVSYAIDDDWAVLGAGLFEFAGETGVDIGDAATYGGYFGVRYRFSKTFSATFGGGYKTRLEEDGTFLPLLGLEWEINEKVTLASDGLGLKLTGKIDEQWTASIFGRYERREYRLDDDAPIADGIVRDSRVPVGVGIEWKPSEKISIELSGGIVAWQEYRFDDSGGTKIRDVNTDPAGFVGLSAEFRF